MKKCKHCKREVAIPTWTYCDNPICKRERISKYNKRYARKVAKKLSTPPYLYTLKRL